MKLRRGCGQASGHSLFARASRNHPRATTTIKAGRLLCWQVLTIALMLVDYSAYYVGRSDYFVALTVDRGRVSRPRPCCRLCAHWPEC